MLVEDLARVFTLVLKDYDQAKVDHLFHIAQAALQARNNPANYNTHASNVRSGAIQLIEQSYYTSLPQRLKDIFETSKFASVSPERLGKMFLAALTADPQRAISSGELNGDLDAYHIARSTMNAFLGACNTVNIHPMEPDTSKAHFQLSFTELNHERSMESTAAILKRWNIAFKFISRYSLGRIEPVEIEYVGTTDLTFWLSTSFSLFQSIIGFYHQILEAANSTIKVLNALGIMKNSGHLPPSGPDAAQIAESNVSNIVAAFINNVSAGAEADQHEEITAGIKVSARLILEDVLNGARISVEYIKDVIPAERDKHSNFDEQKIKELLAQNALLQIKLADYTGKERVLMPSHDDAQTQVATES